MKNILITGIGGDLGQSISRVISDEFQEINIYGSDLNNLNSGNLFCDEIYFLPFASDSNYISSLVDLMNKLKIDLLIPSTEQEQSKILTNLKNNKLQNFDVLGCFPEIYSIGRDKLVTIEWLSDKGIQVPYTKLISNIDKENIVRILNKYKKLILKKREGSGSREIFIIEKLSEIPKQVYEEPSKWIIQEFIPNDSGEYTIAVSVLNNNSNYIQFKRILNYGSTSHAEVINNKEINNLVKKIINNLNYDAAFNIQLRLKNGVPMIFEINPRFSSTVYARHLMGFPDLAEWISYRLEKKKNFKYNFKIGSKFYRYFAYEIR